MPALKRKDDDRDSKRVFRFAAVVAALLIVLALAFNALWPRGEPRTIDVSVGVPSEAPAR
ncbi:MAG: hypothetical protein EOP81_13080 [Variovorax sp.]|nr:MAG: hypothetical protein EOP81_13080 [Variovorax sp.]